MYSEEKYFQDAFLHFIVYSIFMQYRVISLSF